MPKNLLSIFKEYPLISTDTRAIKKESLFFALKGGNFNGNEFAMKAIELGASYAIIDEEKYQVDDRFILVNDVLESLQNLARDYRNQHRATFIAITGSNGKTTSKELIREVLLKKYKVYATYGNLNNHIGVPLTLLSVPEDTDIAIVEMGANHQKEIEFLCKIALPDYGLITNIGKAHLEGFGGIEGVKKGKGELFDFIRESSGKVFVNLNTDKIPEMAQGMNRIDYNSEGGKYQIQLGSSNPKLKFSWRDQNKKKFDTRSNLTGSYNIQNMAAAIAIGDHFDVEGADIHKAIEEYEPDNNRSQIEKTDKNTLILDAYNANPSSLEQALINLAKQEDIDKFFIIGDMLEMGDYSMEEHQKILDLATNLGLKGITVGQEFQKVSKQFLAFESNQDAGQYIESNPIENHLVLIKGSRGIKLETLVKFL